MSEDSKLVETDGEAAEEAKPTLYKPPAPEPPKSTPERWVPTPMDRVWVDEKVLNANEILEVCALGGESFEALYLARHSVKMFRAVLCVTVRRRTPDFTMEEAGALDVNSWASPYYDPDDFTPTEEGITSLKALIATSIPHAFMRREVQEQELKRSKARNARKPSGKK